MLCTSTAFHQNDLRDHVVVLPGEVCQRLVGAHTRVLSHRLLFAVDGQEDVAVTLGAPPLGGFRQGHSRRLGGRRRPEPRWLRLSAGQQMRREKVHARAQGVALENSLRHLLGRGKPCPLESHCRVSYGSAGQPLAGRC